MSQRKVTTRTRAKGPATAQDHDVDAILASLRQLSTPHDRENLSRFSITADKALGVSMANMKRLAASLGRDHALAEALWRTGWYEARMLASLVDEPARVTPAQMDRWCRDFDNWAICDTVCFALFDRTPHAWDKVALWSQREAEFVKRAAFALLWGLSVHDKQASDDRFREGLALIERAAADERHYVKKALNMALRAVGKRNSALRGDAVTVATRLSALQNEAARWMGKDALRELAASRPRRPPRTNS